MHDNHVRTSLESRTAAHHAAHTAHAAEHGGSAVLFAGGIEHDVALGQTGDDLHIVVVLQAGFHLHQGTGHLLGATAAVEALACIFAIDKGIVPPTINIEELDPQIDSKLNLTLGEAQKRDVKVAMSNTFGFGGHNSTMIFRKL